MRLSKKKKQFAADPVDLVDENGRIVAVVYTGDADADRLIRSANRHDELLQILRTIATAGMRLDCKHDDAAALRQLAASAFASSDGQAAEVGAGYVVDGAKGAA